jgi:isochorismate pyruvate lyase
VEKPVDQLHTMQDIRAAIDALDAELVALLGKRMRVIERAGEIKKGEGLPARITERVEEVVSNVRQLSQQHGLKPDVMESLWRALIEDSIRREEEMLK